MTENHPEPHATPNAFTSLPSRMVNILVSPSYVFDEVLNSPHRVLNWVVPMVLVCLASLLLLDPATTKERIAAGIQSQLEKESISATQADQLPRAWHHTSVMATCSAVVIGTGWSALVIWFLGRFLLKANFSFFKALEVAGLAQVILVLGLLVTLLLIAAIGDPAARPALSFLRGRIPPEHPLRAFLDTLNVFHIWTTAVLAIGLARLSGVSAKEAGFWVFGYWVILRGALILLA